MRGFAMGEGGLKLGRSTIGSRAREASQLEVGEHQICQVCD